MAKLFDADGKEIEAFTKEEVDALAKAASEKALADFRAANPEKKEEPPAKVDGAPASDEILKQALDRIGRVESTLMQERVDRFADRFAGTDTTKRTEFVQAFSRLTGYEDTADGLAKRATDASRLAFGTAEGINTADLSSGGARNIDGKKTSDTSEVDKTVQAALGITAADAEKFGPK